MMLGAKQAVLASLRNQSIAEVFREETSPSRTESNVEMKVLPSYPGKRPFSTRRAYSKPEWE